MLLNQQTPQPLMKVLWGNDMISASLQCLITHFICVMMKPAGDKTLLTPLTVLAQARQNVKVFTFVTLH